MPGLSSVGLIVAEMSWVSALVTLVLALLLSSVLIPTVVVLSKLWVVELLAWPGSSALELAPTSVE